MSFKTDEVAYPNLCTMSDYTVTAVIFIGFRGTAATKGNSRANQRAPCCFPEYIPTRAIYFGIIYQRDVLLHNIIATTGVHGRSVTSRKTCI